MVCKPHEKRSRDRAEHSRPGKSMCPQGRAGLVISTVTFPCMRGLPRGTFSSREAARTAGFVALVAAPWLARNKFL